MTASKSSRTDLALTVYTAVLEGTESFEENNFGAYVAYLLGAILKGLPTSCGSADNFVGLTPTDEGAVQFVHVLRKAFPEWTHSVWEYISLFGDDMEFFPVRIKAAIIEGRDLGNLDEEDYPAASDWQEALKKLSALDK